MNRECEKIKKLAAIALPIFEEALGFAKHSVFYRTYLRNEIFRIYGNIHWADNNRSYFSFVPICQDHVVENDIASCIGPAASEVVGRYCLGATFGIHKHKDDFEDEYELIAAHNLTGDQNNTSFVNMHATYNRDFERTLLEYQYYLDSSTPFVFTVENILIDNAKHHAYSH